MALYSTKEIIDHFETQLKTITTDNGYNNTVLYVDKEYRERSTDQYPFFFINDVEVVYNRRICKDLYEKLSIIDLVGFVFDDNRGADQPQLGSTLKLLIEDLKECLRLDAYFNTSDIELEILEIVTEEDYVPPHGSFVCRVAVKHFNNK